MNGGLTFGATLRKNGTIGITQRQMRNLRRAAQVANTSDFHVQVGAVAMCGTRILSFGCNSAKSHPMQADFSQSRSAAYNTHAEIACLAPLRTRKDIDWSKVTLYVCRLRHDRPYGMARPCPACMAAIQSLGIRHIVYTTNDGVASENIFKKVS